MFLTSPKKFIHHFPKSVLCAFPQMSSFKISANWDEQLTLDLDLDATTYET